MSDQARLYGVSFGDGNNGVSHSFADYYVRTSEPYTLARAAMLAQFKADKGQAWAQQHMDVAGEAEYTIYATLSNPPCEDTADGEYPECEDDENAEDGRNWAEHNGAWMICEVFPEDSPRDGRMVYDSLDDALTADVVALARTKEN